MSWTAAGCGVAAKPRGGLHVARGDSVVYEVLVGLLAENVGERPGVTAQVVVEPSSRVALEELDPPGVVLAPAEEKAVVANVGVGRVCVVTVAAVGQYLLGLVLGAQEMGTCRCSWRWNCRSGSARRGFNGAVALIASVAKFHGPPHKPDGGLTGSSPTAALILPSRDATIKVVKPPKEWPVMPKSAGSIRRRKARRGQGSAQSGSQKRSACRMPAPRYSHWGSQE